MHSKQPGKLGLFTFAFINATVNTLWPSPDKVSPMSKPLKSAVSLLIFILACGAPRADEVKLPNLGNAGGSLYSSEQEYKLGQAWLRSFRSQVRTVSDPILAAYLEDLIYRLATHSQLEDRRLELVVVHNAALNAFAVPGGVIGLHDGLLLHARNEDELAAVLAHELAHLSQRHFQRGREEAKRNRIPNMAALLASLVILATAGGDAGIAAITATQAAALQNQLRFSRQHEIEADRIGMLTLVDAGIDPNAIPSMFERMQRASRYRRNPPEFLSSHPVTEKRIADSRSRARKYAVPTYTRDIEYQLMRARVQVSYADNTGAAIKRFKTALENGHGSATAARYGLVLAYIKTNKLQEAHATLQPLLEKDPQRTTFIAAQAELETRGGNYVEAADLLKQQLRINPKNHPLTMQYAEVLLKQGNAKETQKLLLQQVKRHPHDEHLWYLLAETHGLVGDIPAVHQARAEYFILNGVFDQARKQLRYALKLVQGDYLATAKISERMQNIEKMQEAIKI